jgi:hypothetical protein
MKLGTSLILYTKINSKLINNLNARAKNIKTQKKIGNLHDMGCGNGFLKYVAKNRKKRKII